MERRTALKNVLFSATSLLTLPAWANSWNSNSLQISDAIFNENQLRILEILVDSLIPSSTIPGAKDLGIPIFVNKMLTDCYDNEVQISFKNGLGNAEKLAKDSFSKSLFDCDMVQKNELLKKMATSGDVPQKEFFTLLKSLTVLGYTTTEYVMTKHYNYVMAPGHYYGCVNV